MAALHGAITREQPGLLGLVFAGEVVERLGNIQQWIAAIAPSKSRIADMHGDPCHRSARTLPE